MNKNFLLSLFILLLTIPLQAQVGMGKWRTHFAFNEISELAQSENKVFAVSEGKLFSIDKRDKSSEFYNKITGLSGNSISKIAYSTDYNTLIIAYNDGNIDFMSSSGIKNLPDYYNKLGGADKDFNDIVFYRNQAFLSTKFGIMVLNMDKNEIKDSYYIGNNASEVEVLNTTILGDSIYATTSNSIYSANVNNSMLISYEHWTQQTDLPGSGDIFSIRTFGKWLVLHQGNTIYRKEAQGTWSVIQTSEAVRAVEVSNGYLLAHSDNFTYLWDEQFTISHIEINDIKTAIYDSKSKQFWLGGNNDGLTAYKPADHSIDHFKPNGPFVNNPYRIRFGGNRMFVFQGGRWDYNWMRPGHVMIYEDNEWSVIDNSTITSQTNRLATDFMDVAVDPQDKKHFYVSSYGNGVFEFRNDQFHTWHTLENSTIEPVSPTSNNRLNYMRIDGGIYDKAGNIWFTNSLTPSIIQVLKNDGTWTNFSNQAVTSMPTLSEVLISNKNQNQKWVLSMRYTPGVIIMDDNGTLDKKSDDRYKLISTFRYYANDEIQEISPSFFYSMAQDKNGAIWIGTNDGPLIINNPDKAFDNDFMVSRIIIPRNDGTGQGDILLKDLNITAIVIDGANRKWIGTRDTGLYLISENGLETIYHFTTENSPLISNEILSIAIHPATGEVFIGTSRGLISYQADAAEGKSVFTNVHAYPNPVRENYDGIITITGLVDNTQVKIVDSAGHLVYETKSNGSLATWNGRNKQGQKVSTGIYIALCITADGDDSAQAKILVIN